MKKTCTITGETFEISDWEREHLSKVSPVINGETIEIPTPTLCPDQRLRRRLAHHNERNLYKSTCAKTGKNIVTMYDPKSAVTVYDNSEWWSDSWDATSYGRDIDFTISFFEQLQQLRRVVPRMALTQDSVENSVYTSCVSHLKNCYLLFTSDFSQDCAYGVWTQNCRDCYDNFMVDKCELCYECMFADACYNCMYVLSSSNCSDSKFLFDCHGCSNCFLSFGLRNKQYCIKNTQYSKEEYEAKIAEFSMESSTNKEIVVRLFADLIQNEALHLYMWKKGRVEQSSGDLLQDAENCQNCFEVMRSKDCMYSLGYEMKDALDCTYANAELGYENCECFPMAFRSAFNVNSYGGANLYYCDLCMNNCSDCFGCVGLKHKQYCIFNKQYSKEEYEALVPKLIEHMRKDNQWGEFMPIEMSHFAYNQSLAQDYFPVTRQETAEQNLRWVEKDNTDYQPATATIPNNVRDVKEDITKEIFACSCCTKNYKFITQEIQFYKKIGVALPTECFECRYARRRTRKNPRTLHSRTCVKCSTSMKSVYSEDRQEAVCCKECYLASI